MYIRAAKTLQKMFGGPPFSGAFSASESRILACNALCAACKIKGEYLICLLQTRQNVPFDAGVVLARICAVVRNLQGYDTILNSPFASMSKENTATEQICVDNSMSTLPANCGFPECRLCGCGLAWAVIDNCRTLWGDSRGFRWKTLAHLEQGLAPLIKFCCMICRQCELHQHAASIMQSASSARRSSVTLLKPFADVGFVYQSVCFSDRVSPFFFLKSTAVFLQP